MSTILCIDTASPEIAVALAIDGEIVAAVSRDATMQHSQVLLTTIDSVIGGQRDQLTGIAVVRGPGSYAGLRVGLATAQGLALSLGVTIRGISTLEAVALADGGSDCLAIHPAGRGEFGVQPFHAGVPTGAVRVAGEVELPAHAEPRTLVGEGAGPLGGVEVTPEQRCRAALLALQQDFQSGSNAEVDAVYLREPNITVPRAKRPAAPTH